MTEKTPIPKKEKRLITAALPYVNNVPHLGHLAGSHLPADIFARYCRSKGYETLFVGGSDENGTPCTIVAEKIGVPLPKFLETVYNEHVKVYNWFNISYDNFTRTTSNLHAETVKDFFHVLEKVNAISEGKMSVYYSPEEEKFLPDRYVVGECISCGYKEADGDQCEKCSSMLGPSDLKNVKSKSTGSPVESREVDHLFFNLDEYSSELSGWINSKEKVWRKQVSNLAHGWIKQGLKPRCISRDIEHGIKIPRKGFEDKVFYVWFDAPIGYISSTKEVAPNWKDFWCNDSSKIYNFVGKDNIPFHTLFWPAMMMAHKNINLPENVVGLQYLNFEGKKFSKSKKIGVFCEKLPALGVPVDVWRSYITQLIPESNDTEFKWKEFQERTNSDLIGNFGNYVNRIIKFTNAKLKGKLQKPKESDFSNEDKEILKQTCKCKEEIGDLIEKAKIRKAYSKILELSSIGNKYINDMEPWTFIGLKDDRANVIMYTGAEILKTLAIVSAPFIPDTSEKIWKQLNLEESPNKDGIWESNIDFKDNHEFATEEILFEKLTDDKIKKYSKITAEPTDLKNLFGIKNPKPNKQEILNKTMENIAEIKFEDFTKIDLRVAQITNVEEIPKADKLYKLTLNCGELGQRTIAAGIKEFYSSEDLKNKKVIIIANLAPRKLRGIQSQGMLLAASTKEGSPESCPPRAKKTVSLISPNEEVIPGSKIDFLNG